MELADLPTLNATLNSCSFIALMTGYVAIRRGRRSVHIGAMLVALGFSAAFLTSYLIYHFHPDTIEQTFPKGTGAIRGVYLAVLISHIILAVVIVPLVLVTVTLAARRNWKRHKRWARVTLPIWAYVSISGVAVYAMLYHLAPTLKAASAATL